MNGFMTELKSFILTEWADIMPETLLVAGAWSRNGASLTLAYTNVIDGFDAAYTTMVYDDGQKRRLIQVGNIEGQKQFNKHIREEKDAVRKARTEYMAIADRSTNFVFRSWAEEFTYVMMFSAGYAMRSKIAPEDADRLKAEIIRRCARTCGQGTAK